MTSGDVLSLNPKPWLLTLCRKIWTTHSREGLHDRACHMDYVKHMCEVSVARPIGGESKENWSRVKRIQLSPETTFPPIPDSKRHGLLPSAQQKR